MIIMEEKTTPNELNISPKEISALTSCRPDVRYKYTIKRIADTETMRTVGMDDQTFAVQQNGDEYLLPIWSSKEFAMKFGSAYMKEYSCIPISIDEFEDSDKDMICERGYLLNLSPTQIEEFGQIVDFNRFADDLSEALSEYN